jgi:small subunit ribosomal protein S1
MGDSGGKGREASPGMASSQNQEHQNPEFLAGEEDYEHLLEDYSHFAPPAEGEILQGTVLKVTAKEVIVDFGYKSEGLVPIEQFQGPGGEVKVQPGETIDVMIDHGERHEDMCCFRMRVCTHRVWTISRKPISSSSRFWRVPRVRGGLSVDVGVNFHARSKSIRIRSTTRTRLSARISP